jgi:hypothetical protein
MGVASTSDFSSENAISAGQNFKLHRSWTIGFDLTPHLVIISLIIPSSPNAFFSSYDARTYQPHMRNCIVFKEEE